MYKVCRGYVFKCISFLVVFFLVSESGFAAVTTVGSMASHITGSFENLAKLITASSYLAGLGFSIGAIMKFKQHKDNPTQIPVKSKKFCKFPLIQPIKLVRYLVKACIPTTLDFPASLSASQSLNSSILR